MKELNRIDRFLKSLEDKGIITAEMQNPKIQTSLFVEQSLL